MSINSRIFDLLEKANDGQANLARFLGISQTNITNWKNRKTDPPAKYLIKICEFLNVSVLYILTGTQEEPHQKEVINEDETRTLEYYRRLDTENKDYIKGEMIKLYKQQESDKGNNEGYTRGMARK